MDYNPAERDATIEDIVVAAMELMSDETFELFIAVRLTGEEVENLYQDLTLWRRLSEEILTAFQNAR